jgi:hypothetical protein
LSASPPKAPAAPGSAPAASKLRERQRVANGAVLLVMPEATEVGKRAGLPSVYAEGSLHGVLGRGVAVAVVQSGRQESPYASHAGTVVTCRSDVAAVRQAVGMLAPESPCCPDVLLLQLSGNQVRDRGRTKKRRGGGGGEMRKM